MTQIGSFDLEKKTAVVAVILEKPLENSKKAAEKGADILEIRLDLLGIRTPERAAEVIREIKAETGIPIIVTSRSGAEGGKWDGKEEDRTGLLINLLSLKDGPDAIDIELSAGMKERNRVIKAAKDRETAVIVSSHDFLKTPPLQNMRTIIEEMFLAGADIAKLAVMPLSVGDTLNLLRVTLDFKDAGKSVCTIAMGSQGKHTRVVAPFYGSVLTYASIESNASAAPGQLPVDEVKKIMEMLK
ncbi:type I 3-dehydroquinate dehydratase [Methanosarcina mazei]|uniref:3-dehydroquinate dehydratase n=3 Tax=Methanosarcina mazei TaxID=2209 RepID=AROD_METMA|nr:type I 3-dehydroquinate dehydratase [Methanosarcina mazei]Q8PXE7.1 RecName: Full=3-dehydroquinate dehydratase; Short=3-dehydroquinase; AltName: Full=Type I DHQase; AltName: Full=Type I dehydroquinase; Short=DHQ1 [Methanosarcina mazei Go1]AAM30969.1 3-dehydroquinate dehydratase [Methanosarcina mazei Go1]AKB60030.1 3-dehydroquinate dehydratase I [Methanosarcina mazei SarPi]AKB63239.1 3-dehydroquinate dehydratase I [Methanosarcina mazei S-6]WIM44499.1 type I 3-dehydroquinate dehydratase [Metha